MRETIVLVKSYMILLSYFEILYIQKFLGEDDRKKEYITYYPDVLCSHPHWRLTEYEYVYMHNAQMA